MMIIRRTFIAISVFTAVAASGQTDAESESAESKAAAEARAALTELERDALDRDRTASTWAKVHAVMESFLAAPNYLERSKFVRDRKRVEPLMKKFYATNPDNPTKFRKLTERDKMSVRDSYIFRRFQTEDFVDKPIAFERQEDGSFLVDWESYVGYCEIPWKKIVKTRSTRPFLVRCLLSEGDYFNNGFDDDEWVCVRLEDGDRNYSFYAYAKKGSALDLKLKDVLKPDGTTYVTVKVAYPEDESGGKNQLLLKEILTRGWVLPVSSEPQEK